MRPGPPPALYAALIELASNCVGAPMPGGVYHPNIGRTLAAKSALLPERRGRVWPPLQCGDCLGPRAFAACRAALVRAPTPRRRHSALTAKATLARATLLSPPCGQLFPARELSFCCLIIRRRPLVRRLIQRSYSWRSSNRLVCSQQQLSTCRHRGYRGLRSLQVQLQPRP